MRICWASAGAARWNAWPIRCSTCSGTPKDLGLTEGDRIEFPFFQQRLADALGILLVHANNTLRRLTSQKIVHWKPKVFRLLDRGRWRKSPTTIFAERKPRPFI